MLIVAFCALTLVVGWHEKYQTCKLLLQNHFGHGG